MMDLTRLILDKLPDVVVPGEQYANMTYELRVLRRKVRELQAQLDAKFLREVGIATEEGNG